MLNEFLHKFLGSFQGLPAVVLHTFVIYLFLILIFRFIGRRQTSELSVTELIIIMMLGSGVETAMVDGNTSLAAGFVSAGTLLVSNYVLSFLLFRVKPLRLAIAGGPIPLVYDGRFLERGLDRADLTHEDVLEGIREQGYEKVDDVHLAVLERDGQISVIPKKDLSKKEKKREK